MTCWLAIELHQRLSGTQRTDVEETWAPNLLNSPASYLSSLRWMGIVAVAVLPLNFPFLVVNNELCPLILTDLSTCTDCLSFRSTVATSTARTGLFNIPPSLRIGDYVM